MKKESKRNLSTQLAGGVVVALLIVGAVWAILFFSFFDIFVFSSIHMEQARMQAGEIVDKADMRAREILTREILAARKDLVESRSRDVTFITKSRDKGTRGYWSSIRDYFQINARARARYRKAVTMAKIEPARIRREAADTAATIMAQAREEYAPLSLMLSALRHRGKVKGYLYDPATGRIEPDVDATVEKESE